MTAARRTSAETLKAVTESGVLSKQRIKFYTALVFADAPCTAGELAAWMSARTGENVDVLRHTANRRLSELVRFGVAIETAPRYCAETGRRCIVYESTDGLPNPEAFKKSIPPRRSTPAASTARPRASYALATIARDFPFAVIDKAYDRELAVEGAGDRLFVHARLPRRLVERVDAMGTRTDVLTRLVAVAFEAIDNAAKVRSAMAVLDGAAVDRIITKELE